MNSIIRNSFMLLAGMLLAGNIFSQSFSVNTDGSSADASAILDVKSTTKGILIPRLTKVQKNSISAPATGLMIYQTGPDSTGFYYYNGTIWNWMLALPQGSYWSLLGNTGTDTLVNFIGTTDNMPIRIRQNNRWIGQFNSNNKTFSLGTIAGSSITTGTANVFIGDSAAYIATSAAGNTIVGANAATALSTGTQNVIIGYLAGKVLSTGQNNIYIGYNTAAGGGGGGSRNTVIGQSASTTASVTNGTALGYNAAVNQSNSMVFGDITVTKWGFGTNATAANILEFNSIVTTASLTTGGVWTNASDKNIKQNFSVMDKSDVLNKIMQLPVTRWSYTKEGNDVTHIGPMAQDFYRLFNTGQNDRTISTIDPSGVALLAIQQLKNENEVLTNRLTEQEEKYNQLLKKLKSKGIID
jgi:Chaperone of endosialidase